MAACRQPATTVMTTSFSFLRPLAPPRSSTLNLSLLQRRRPSRSTTSSTASRSSFSTTARTSKGTSVTVELPKADSTSARPSGPYFVRRTHTRNLPVYERLKRGGNLRVTEVRKIEGDVAALRDELMQELGLERVILNALTKNLVIPWDYSF